MNLSHRSGPPGLPATTATATARLRSEDPADGLSFELDRDLGNQLLWKYGGDLRFFLVVGQVAILQMMHPAFDAVVAGNSEFFNDVWRRWFERTQPMLQKMVFSRKADAIAKDVRDIHKGMRGVDAHGRTWHALNPDVFHFAHATQYYAIWQMIELFDGRRLSQREREAYYQATRRLWSQFGMRDRVAPPDWPSFLRYYDAFCETDLEATPGALQMLEFLSSAPPPPIRGLPQGAWRVATRPVFEQYGRICTGLLPASARQKLGLTWTAADQRWLRTTAGAVAAVAHVTPDGLLLTPEARAAHGARAKTIPQRLEYIAGEAVQRPIRTAWRHATS